MNPIVCENGPICGLPSQAVLGLGRLSLHCDAGHSQLGPFPESSLRQGSISNYTQKRRAQNLEGLLFLTWHLRTRHLSKLSLNGNRGGLSKYTLRSYKGQPYCYARNKELQKTWKHALNS